MARNRMRVNRLLGVLEINHARRDIFSSESHKTAGILVPIILVGMITSHHTEYGVFHFAYGRQTGTRLASNACGAGS